MGNSGINSILYHNWSEDGHEGAMPDSVVVCLNQMADHGDENSRIMDVVIWEITDTAIGVRPINRSTNQWMPNVDFGCRYIAFWND